MRARAGGGRAVPPQAAEPAGLQDAVRGRPVRARCWQDDLWLRNATHANAMARRLADGAGAVAGVEIVHPVQANAVFARLSARHIEALRRDWVFHLWDEAAAWSAG